MKKYIKTLCLSLMLTFSASALAQNQTVSGTVLDEAGEPVIGATVTVAGTKTATITDFDGNYKITIPKGGKVTISYIGYLTQTVTPGGTVKPAQIDSVYCAAFVMIEISGVCGISMPVPR